MPNDYFHAIYSAGSISESDLLVDESLILMPWRTTSAESLSESDSVDESLRLMPNDYFHATYSARGISESIISRNQISLGA